MNKRKMGMSFKCAAVLLAVMLAFTGCQGKALKDGDSDEWLERSDSEMVSDTVGILPANMIMQKIAISTMVEPAAESVPEEGTVVFTGYDGEKIFLSPSDTSVSITLYSSMDKAKLAQLTWVKELDLRTSYNGPQISLNDIKSLTQLESLSVTYADIKDISALSELTNLKKLDLSGNKITDFSALAKLTNLEELDLTSMKISDISPLSELKNLKDLNLIANKIQDISPLADLTQLEYLRLQENEISDVSPLAGLKNLHFLALDENPIKDLTPLSNLDSQTKLCIRGMNLAWDAWEPVKHLDEVDGRPPVANVGTIPCPQNWVDRIAAEYPEGLIISLDYDDYDKDGAYEAFALVSDGAVSDFGVPDSGYTGALVMVTENSMQELLRDWQIDVGGYYWFNDTKVIFANNYLAVTSSVSYLWTVEGGKPRTMNLSQMGQWFYVDEFGNVCVQHSAYDGASDYTGHSYKPYFFYFDGYDFVEYGAIPITEEEFLRCKGAEEVLEEIREEGLELTEILYRGNGMIHINLREYWEDEKTGESSGFGDSAESDEDDDRDYYNSYKTFHLSEDGQLTLIDSYMGYYYDCYVITERVPTEYPACFPIQ